MIRVTSLTAMSDRQLDRLIKRVALILVIGAIAFVGFYVVDRFRMPAASMTDQRVAALEQAVRDDPTDITSRGQLADLYTAAGRYDEAIAQYTAILDAGKEIELAHFGRGSAYKANGELDAAIVDFQAVVDIAKDGEMANVDPMLEAAYYALGAMALDQARPTDAIDSLEKAIAIKRSDADALHLLAKAYVATGETAKAIDRAKAAIAFVPIGWTEPYLTLSEAYTAAGEPEMAAWASAMAEFSDGKVDDATAHLTPLAASGPAEVDAAIGLGLIAETAGDMIAAADWYEQALAVEPDNAAARLGLSRTREVASPAPVVSPSPMPSLPNPGDLSGGEG